MVRAANPGEPIFDLHPPNNFDFSKKKVIKKISEEMSRKTWVFLLPIGSLRIIPPPPISKNSPKYADHPPNAGHGFAALFMVA